jgi:hypothetical protein
VYRVDRRAEHPIQGHKMLIAMAVLAVAYCLGAPLAANLIAHFGS